MERQTRDPRIEGFIVDNAIPIPGIEWEGAPDPLPLDHDLWYGWFARQLARRAMVESECARDPEQRRAHDALCAQPGGIGHIYWLCTFGFIHEPRSDEERFPYVLEPAQAELVLLYHAVLATPKGAKSSIAVEKARQVGATWIDASFHAWNWQFSRNWSSLVLSRTEDMVDKKGIKSTFFWKVDFLLKNQPSWMLPRGFAFAKPHRVNLAILNPVNENAIEGSATVEDAGRAGRYKWITFDEANFNPFFAAGWNSSASSTDHRSAISSASQKLHKHFYNMVRGLEGYQGKQPTVFIFHWWMRPGRDQAWLDNERETMDDTEFRIEVLMDYRAGVGAWVYPMFELTKTQRLEPIPHLPKYIGIDDGITDPTALVGFQVHPATGDIDVLWGYQNFGMTIDFYGYLLTGQMNAKFPWTDYERELIHWLQRHRLTSEATYYGDRHGYDTNMVTDTSPFEELTKQTGIYIVTNLDPSRNTHVYRQKGVQQAASRMRFNDQWGAPDVLHALREARFPDSRETSQKTMEARTPIHGAGSHYRTAVEYWWGNYSFGAFEPDDADAMMLPPNPVSRFGEQFEQAHRRRRGEIPTTEEAIPRWMR